MGFIFQLNYKILFCFVLFSFIYAIGNKELGLIPIDPLHLDKFSIVQNEQSPVNIRLNLRNITVTGLKDIVVSKVVLVHSLLSYRSLCIKYSLNFVWFICFAFCSGFDRDPKTSKFEVTGKTPKLSFLGKYTLNGQGTDGIKVLEKLI